MIPKKIYFTWIAEIPVPEKFQKFIRSWSRVMPDYEIQQITLENVKRSAFVDKAIAIKNYAVAGHYARVQELYENGGIYFDIDVQAVKRFDAFLNEKLVLGAESKNWVNNAVIIAEAGHPFLKKCLDYMDNFSFDSEKIELATGPIMFTNIAREYGWTSGTRQEQFGDIKILPPEHFYPYHWDQFYSPECIKEKTFSVHHWGNSWNNRVSVVIPCYKQAHFLSAAIYSVKAQTYKDVEIIVVNDGSPDNTSYMAKTHSVKLIEQPNKGLGAARNAGIKKASGGWIITLDADDKLHPQFIEKTIGKSDIVSTGLETFGTQKRRWISQTPNPTHKDFLQRNHINCCSLFKKDVWTMAGGYDENMRDGYEDWDFWIRATQAGFNVQVINEFLFFYRKHSVSLFAHAKNNHDKIVSYMRGKYPEFLL